MRIAFAGLVWAIVVVLIANPAPAFTCGDTYESHPFHVSIAEVEWNQRSRMLEVALHVWPNDLEEALEDRLGHDVSLENDDSIDEWIANYLVDRFVVLERQEDENEERRKASIEWLGKELTTKSLWLYFEVPLEDGPDGIQFENRLLFEILPDQANLVQYKDGRRKGTLRTTVDEPVKKLEYDQLRIGL